MSDTMAKIGMILGAIAIVIAGVGIQKWRYDTCIAEGLSKTYCWQRIIFN